MSKLKFSINFLGASQTVTGSSYLVESSLEDKVILKFMVDHGMFQGPDVFEHNYDKYDFDPKDIDFLLLTHTHVDHCGRLPRLVREGYNSPIFCTKQTAELLELILFDSAKVQGYKQKDEGIDILYDNNDVEKTLDLVEIIDINQKIQFESNGQDIFVTAKRAGHVLGAVSYFVEIAGKNLFFSGDIGRESQRLIKPYDTKSVEADVVVTESLYGGKEHEDRKDTESRLASAINKTLDRNGNVIIPTFSVQRSQEILVLLNNMLVNKQIPVDVDIIFDSPLAQRVTKVYTNNMPEISKSTISPYKNLQSAIFTKNVRAVKNYGMTKKVKKNTKQIIVTGGGMVNGGKVMDYLKTFIYHSNDLIALVGFQAEETVGRELLEGAKEVEIDGETYPVNINVDYFGGFSAHGDQTDLLKWLKRCKLSRLRKVFLVHAEIEQARAYKDYLTKNGYNEEMLLIPKLYEEFEFEI